jgi:hypothetical protein
VGTNFCASLSLFGRGIAAVEDLPADKTAVLLRGVAQINLSNHLIENRMVRPIQSIDANDCEFLILTPPLSNALVCI